MSGVRLFLFIVLLPAIAALGHDIYLFVTNTGLDNIEVVLDQDTRPWHSYFATGGYIWTQYHPESFSWAAQNLPQEQWAVLNEVLSLKAVVIGLLFAGIFWLILGVFKILGVWPFRQETRAERSHGRTGHKTGQRFKYTRK